MQICADGKLCHNLRGKIPSYAEPIDVIYEDGYADKFPTFEDIKQRVADKEGVCIVS